MPAEWFMVHMIRYKEVPAHAIWRVWIDVCETVSHVSIEVPIDKHQSTSMYRWNHDNSSNTSYMMFDELINILFEQDTSVSSMKCRYTLTVYFFRHFVYDDKLTRHIPGQAPDGNKFSFHKQR